MGDYVDENTDTLQNTIKLNITQITVLIFKVKHINMIAELKIKKHPIRDCV